MKAIIAIVSIMLLGSSASAQTILEIGGQKNFLQKEPSFESVSSYSANAALMFQNNGFPVYGGITLNYFYAKDQLLEANKFQQTLPGIKAGIRPLANFLMIPVQLFAEGYYNHSVSQKNPGIKSFFGYGGGLELYYTKRHAVAFYYGIEQYRFAAGEQLSNSIARVSLRFHLN
jgi:hypothetical protein